MIKRTIKVLAIFFSLTVIPYFIGVYQFQDRASTHLGFWFFGLFSWVIHVILITSFLAVLLSVINYILYGKFEIKKRR